MCSLPFFFHPIFFRVNKAEHIHIACVWMDHALLVATAIYLKAIAAPFGSRFQHCDLVAGTIVVGGDFLW